jgi:hypothetical protein
MNSINSSTLKFTKIQPNTPLQNFIKNYSEFINERIEDQRVGYIFRVSDFCDFNYEFIPDHEIFEIYFKNAVEKNRFPRIRYEGICSARNCDLYKRIK